MKLRALLLTGMLVTACDLQPYDMPAGSGGTQPAAYCNRGMGKTCNPYGLAMSAGAMPDAAYFDLIGTTLGTPFYRPDPLAPDALASCARCDAAAGKGLQLVLVARNGGPPASLDAYRSAIGKAADHYGAALATIVVEDEITGGWSGTTAEYLATLSAACQAAHAHGTRCAAGAVDSTTTLLLVADYYEHHGFPGEALRVLKASSNNPEVGTIGSDADVRALIAAHAGMLADAAARLEGLRRSDADYVNFHWLESDQTAIDEAISLMRTWTGCNAVITDGLGQRSGDVFEAANKLDDAKELGLPIVIWASSPPGDAASVVDASGHMTPLGAKLARIAHGATCED